MKQLAIFIFLSVFFSCSFGNDKSSKNGSNSKEVIFDFLNWYKVNYFSDSLSAVFLVPNAIDSDPANLYFVDQARLKRYIYKLESSGFLSTDLLGKINDYVLSSDQKMKDQKQSDGPPIGLEADLILCTQEIKDALQLIPSELDSLIIKESTDNRYEVELVYKLEFFVSETNSNVLIENINNRY